MSNSFIATLSYSDNKVQLKRGTITGVLTDVIRCSNEITCLRGDAAKQHSAIAAGVLLNLLGDDPKISVFKGSVRKFYMENR